MIKIVIRISKIVEKIFPIRTAIKIIDSKNKGKSILSLFDNKTSFCNIEISNFGNYLKMSESVFMKVCPLEL